MNARLLVVLCLLVALLTACGGSAEPTTETVERTSETTSVEVTQIVEGEAAEVVVPEPAEDAAGDDAGVTEEAEAVATEATDTGGAPMPESGAGAGESAAPLATVVVENASPPLDASQPPIVDRSSQFEAVTAGVVDDNEQWNGYLDYLSGTYYYTESDLVAFRDVRERYIVRVVDENQQPVHDAAVQVFGVQELLFEGRTDAGGTLRFHPRALDVQTSDSRFTLVATKGQARQQATFDRTGGGEITLSLPGAPRAQRPQLDVLFLIDATGSMGDEIDKLKATMGDIADEIARLPQQPDVRYGLVAYRDRGEEYVVRPYNFTPNLAEFQAALGSLQAAAGGDTPEALNEALHVSLEQLSWRGDDTVRLVFLVADAPPHMDYGEPFTYATDMVDAVRRGIKIFPIGASGLDESGQFIFRQLAQFTGGKFVFLTYAQAGNPGSGPGVETDHDVANYTVDTLDRLVVRLVSDELARLSLTQQ